MSDKAAVKITIVRRNRLLVDAKLQGALLAHTTLYWFYCLVSIAVIAVGWILLVRKPATSADLFQQLWFNLGPSLLGAAVLLPLVLMDCLRLSNRFAGPMLRVQRAVKQLAKGEQPAPIHLREGDFFRPFVDDLNVVMGLVQSSSQSVATEAEPVAATAEPATLPAPPAPAESDTAATVPPLAAPINVPVPTVTNIYSDLGV